MKILFIFWLSFSNLSKKIAIQFLKIFFYELKEKKFPYLHAHRDFRSPFMHALAICLCCEFSSYGRFPVTSSGQAAAAAAAIARARRCRRRRCCCRRLPRDAAALLCAHTTPQPSRLLSLPPSCCCSGSSQI